MDKGLIAVLISFFVFVVMVLAALFIIRKIGPAREIAGVPAS